MRTVEDSLRAAASETREYAERQWPNPPAQLAAHQPRGWLAFAAAFAAVVVAFAALPWLMGIDEPDTASQPSPLPAPGADTTTPDGPECSASGAPVPEPDEALPAAVAETRAAIIEAAVGCDLEALIDLAGPGFTTDFGGGDSENLRTWEQDGEGRLGALLSILDMSHAVVGDGNGGETHVWPAAYAYDSWDEIPPEAIEELSSLYTEAELEVISQVGVYGGWRTGIDESGDWMYFVAGD